MARAALNRGNLQISLSSRERYLLRRPNISIELVRVISAALEDFPGRKSLGMRLSGRPLLGGLTGEYRFGSRKIIVLGRRGGGRFLRIKLSHPTLDEIWYLGRDSEELSKALNDPKNK